MSRLDFSACVPASDASALGKKFLEALEALAENFGPLKISSGFRSKEYELSKGRKGTSSHCKGLAVDILVKDGSERHRLLYMAFMMGFLRIGVGKNFVHLDFDTSKPYPTCWHYYE